MRRLSSVRAVPRSAGLAALMLGLAALAPAQPPGAVKGAPKTAVGPLDPDKVQVPITTADGVELDATYYRNKKGGNPKDTPCVILLHQWGSDRTKGEWDALAKVLQNQGYAVVSFDFRGHGNSRSVSPNFWTFGTNKDLVKASRDRDKTKISVTDFQPAYLPWLVNDILAVRKFLEVKNDSGELNTNSIFLIGGQEGAALGALFVAMEWSRTYTVGFKALLTPGRQKPAGEDIAGCVWLSLPARPRNVNFEMANWFKTPIIRDKTPMLFVYGERDRTAGAAADNLLRVLANKNKHTQKLEVKGTDLSGPSLLSSPSLGVNAKIVEYLHKVMADRKAIPWNSVAHDENPLKLVSPRPYGFRSFP